MVDTHGPALADFSGRVATHPMGKSIVITFSLSELRIRPAPIRLYRHPYLVSGAMASFLVW